jgi:hypothetical protein
MSYYILDPEVPGELGSKTKLDTSTHPPRVSALNYELNNWLGDDLFQSFPCFVVTNRLRQKLESHKATGIKFAELELTLSDNFRELHPNTKAPECSWLKVVGKAGEDDFGLSSDFRLVVSESALSVLKTFQLENCEVKTWK